MVPSSVVLTTSPAPLALLGSGTGQGVPLQTLKKIAAHQVTLYHIAMTLGVFLFGVNVLTGKIGPMLAFGVGTWYRSAPASGEIGAIGIILQLVAAVMFSLHALRERCPVTFGQFLRDMAIIFGKTLLGFLPLVLCVGLTYSPPWMSGLAMIAAGAVGVRLCRRLETSWNASTAT
jgi:hypothetical protein